jgi:hypothetical protein
VRLTSAEIPTISNYQSLLKLVQIERPAPARKHPTRKANVQLVGLIHSPNLILYYLQYVYEVRKADAFENFQIFIPKSTENVVG